MALISSALRHDLVCTGQIRVHEYIDSSIKGILQQFLGEKASIPNYFRIKYAINNFLREVRRQRDLYDFHYNCGLVSNDVGLLLRVRLRYVKVLEEIELEYRLNNDCCTKSVERSVRRNTEFEKISRLEAIIG